MLTQEKVKFLINWNKINTLWNANLFSILYSIWK